jgi:hypothetical protein
MKRFTAGLAAAARAGADAPLAAAEIKVDLKKETVGKPPQRSSRWSAPGSSPRTAPTR